MTPNCHVYAICCWPEVDNDVISTEDVETYRCYVCVNTWITSFSSLRENINQLLMYFADDGRHTFAKTVNLLEIVWTAIEKRRPEQNCHVCAIRCQPEVDGDAIVCKNVKTIEGNVVANFEVTSSSSFRGIKKIISWQRRRRWTSTDIDESIKWKCFRA